MSDALFEAQKLKNSINEEPIIKEYLRLKSLLEKDKYFNSIKNKLCKLEKKKELNIEKIKNLQNQLFSYPLYSNFLLVKEEAFSLLKEIKENIDLK